jgi:hypothetical protein
VGYDSHVVFSKTFPGEKENVRCHDATASSSVGKVRGEAQFHSDHKTSQYYAELTVWPARTNSL